METPNARDREEAGQLRRSAGRYRDLGYPATALLFEAEAWRLEHPGESILTLLGLGEISDTDAGDLRPLSAPGGGLGPS